MKSRDVVISGGGLAGLCLARQLRMRFPQLSILVIEKMKRPLPAAAHKVGESLFSGGAFYLDCLLGLHEYVKTQHVPKLGLRWFFTDPKLRDNGQTFEASPEMGRSTFQHAVPEWQLDRGKLENDLRAMIVDAGVELLEGWQTDSVELGDGEHPHQLSLSDEGDQTQQVQARWFIDASGRRRMVQKKLGLQKPMFHHRLPFAPPVELNRHSAVWWRVAAELYPEHIVDKRDAAWHARTIEPAKRYHATNHFVGRGYWVWLIPLPDGNHSVGIVFNEREVVFDEVRTYERAMAWLKIHQPEVAVLLEPHPPLDFLLLRNYSYSSQQVMSSDRWACVGDASAFADPYFSPGTTSIGYLNCLITECIGRDLEGKLEDGEAEMLSDEWIDWLESTTRAIHRDYSFFDRPVVKSGSILQRTAFTGISISMFHSFRYKPGYRGVRSLTDDDELQRKVRRAELLEQRAHALLEEWYAHPKPSRLTFDWVDYAEAVPAIAESLLHGWGKRDIPLIEHFEHTFPVLEAVVLALFRIAVEDVIPDALTLLDNRTHLNAWAVSLDPTRWETDGLFDKPPGFSRPADPTVIAEIRDQVRALYRKREP